MRQESIEVLRNEPLRAALSAVMVQLSDLRRARCALSAVERAEMRAIARAVTRLGLETLLWVYDDARANRKAGVSETARAPCVARIADAAANAQVLRMPLPDRITPD